VLARNAADVDRAASRTFLSAVRQAPQQLFERRSLAHSRVVSAAGLARQARKIMRRHGAALVEEFIEGSEVTVLVAENPDDRRGPRLTRRSSIGFPKASRSSMRR
jgi:hypothetical protein